MKKLLLLITLFLFLGCSKEEEVLTPVFEIALDGDSFDPYERYSIINSFGGEKWGDGGPKMRTQN